MIRSLKITKEEHAPLACRHIILNVRFLEGTSIRGCVRNAYLEENLTVLLRSIHLHLRSPSRSRSMIFLSNCRNNTKFDAIKDSVLNELSSKIGCVEGSVAKISQQYCTLLDKMNNLDSDVTDIKACIDIQDETISDLKQKMSVLEADNESLIKKYFCMKKFFWILKL